MPFKQAHPRRSLASQILFLSVGAMCGVVLLLVAAGGAAVSFAAPFFTRGEVMEQAGEFVQGLRWDGAGNLTGLSLSGKWHDMYDGLSKDSTIRVLDAQGSETLAPIQGDALQTLRRLPWRPGDPAYTTAPGRVPLNVYTLPVHHAGATCYLQVARSSRMATILIGMQSKLFLQAGLVASLVAVLTFGSVALWTVRRMVKPLRDASAAAARIAPGNLATRLATEPLPLELRPLIEAFNLALARLEKGYKVQQEFLASAAHELKTPLALIRAELELGDYAGKAVLLNDLDLMARQVQQLLQLTEASEARNYTFRQVDPAQVAAEVIASLNRLAEAAGAGLHLQEPPAALRIQADPGALYTLIKNLVENAIYHTPSGASVLIAIDPAGISVRDAGEGIQAEDLPRLFERFRRGANARHPGAGLGLSICKEITTAHGWRLEARPSPQSPGAEFRITFDPRGPGLPLPVPSAID